MVALHPDLLATHQIVRIMDTSLLFSRLMLDSQPEVVVLVDAETRVLRINEAGLAFLGLERSAVLGQSLDLLCDNRLKTKFAPFCQHNFDLQTSFFEETKDGKQYIHWKVRRIGVNVRKFEGIETFLVTGNDTTEIHQAQQQAIESEAKHAALQSYLKQELEARILMVSELAHRMNNPLNYISTSLHALHMELQKLSKDIRFLFKEVFEDAEEVRGIGAEFINRIESMDHYVEIIEKGVEKSSLSVSEIRNLSGVDGHNVDKVQLDQAIDTALQRLFENVGEVWRQKLVIDQSLSSEAYIYSNRFAVVIVLEILFRKWTQVMPDGYSLTLLWNNDRPDRPSLTIATSPPHIGQWQEATQQVLPQINHILSGFHLGITLQARSVTIATQDSIEEAKS